MPQRAFRMLYGVDVGAEAPLVGPFATIQDARHWAADFCQTAPPSTECTVRPIMSPLFACLESLTEDAD